MTTCREGERATCRSASLAVRSDTAKSVRLSSVARVTWLSAFRISWFSLRSKPPNCSTSRVRLCSSSDTSRSCACNAALTSLSSQVVCLQRVQDKPPPTHTHMLYVSNAMASTDLSTANACATTSAGTLRSSWSSSLVRSMSRCICVCCSCCARAANPLSREAVSVAKGRTSLSEELGGLNELDSSTPLHVFKTIFDARALPYHFIRICRVRVGGVFRA
jgi:hypothetical protein